MGTLLPPDNGSRVVVVAEDGLARAGLAALVGALPAFYVVGQTAGGEGLPEELELFRPDIVVWDLSPNPVQPIRGLAGLRGSGLPVLALVPNEETAGTVLGYGVRGILPRSAESHTLLAAMNALSEGLTAIDSQFADTILPAREPPPEQPAEPLTPREMEVLQLLAQGISNKAIASRLTISEHTVKFHVNSILSKLDAQSRTEAVTRGTRLGLVKL